MYFLYADQHGYCEHLDILKEHFVGPKCVPYKQVCKLYMYFIANELAFSELQWEVVYNIRIIMHCLSYFNLSVHNFNFIAPLHVSCWQIKVCKALYLHRNVRFYGTGFTAPEKVIFTLLQYVIYKCTRMLFYYTLLE